MIKKIYKFLFRNKSVKIQKESSGFSKDSHILIHDKHIR